MSPRLRSLLAQIGSFVLAGVLLYLALRGVDLGAVLRALRTADYTWLVPLIGIVLFSHVLRAWRWQIFIKALPEVTAADDTRVPSVKLSFYSVMIGYMVNYAAPRLGEVARTANLAAQSRLSFSSLFGTVVAERILDVVVLLLALCSVFALLLDRLATLNEFFLDPISEQVGRLPALGIALGVIALGALVLLIYRQVLRSEASGLSQFWNNRAVPVLRSFRNGIGTVLRSKERIAIAGTTAGMWLLYMLAAYIPFVMLGMAEAYDISLVDAWVIMIIGAIGVVIPSPGGTGSYHYITIQTLVHLYAFTPEAAATYAVLSHAAQLVLYVLTGATCLMLQGSNVRALREETVAAQEDQTT